MGKITDALKKAADERMERIEKVSRIKEQQSFVVKKMDNSNVDARLITYFDPKAVISEQYKTLRTNILSITKGGKPPKVIVITSAIHSEGKTVTALNLAIALAQSTKKSKILLVDADMRRGRVTQYLGVHQPEGLSDVLSGDVSIEDALFHIDIENLTFISGGSIPHNPSELLHSENMRTFLIKARSKFDHIIIDTPPIISVTDSGIVGSQADGVIMVIEAGRTQRGIVKRACELLHQAHTKLLGHILTGIEYHLPEYIYRYL